MTDARSEPSLGAIRAAALLILSLGLGACSDPAAPDQHDVVFVGFPVGNLSLQEGESGQLSAVARDYRGRVVPCSFAWASSNPAIVRVVDQMGNVQGVSPGSADIIATCGNAHGASSVVVARGTVIGVSVVPDIFELRTGETIALRADARSLFSGQLPGRVATWSSSAPGVASVDDAGIVTAHSSGMAEITAVVEGVSGLAVAYLNITAASNVTEIDLGTLGGVQSVAYAINAHGAVVGSSLTINGVEHAFLWTGSGGMVDLGTLGAGTSVAYALNDNGEVVGESQAAGNAPRPFRWTAAHGMQDLGLGTAARATSINSSGEIVGSVIDLNQGFYRDADGIVRTIDGGVVPTSINEAGTVAGYTLTSFYCGYYQYYCTRTAYLWSPTAGLTLLFPEDGTANDVNDHGEVVGERDGLPYRRNSAGAFQTLASLGPRTAGFANSVNDFGEVAGTYRTSKPHAVLWTAGGDLVILSGADSEASAVNDDGWVVGWKSVGGARRATLWRVSGLPRP